MCYVNTNWEESIILYKLIFYKYEIVSFYYIGDIIKIKKYTKKTFFWYYYLVSKVNN